MKKNNIEEIKREEKSKQRESKGNGERESEIMKWEVKQNKIKYPCRRKL